MWMRIVNADDIKKPWQMILSSRYIVLDTWMITQNCNVGDMMMMSSTYMMIGWYLHMLIDADIPKWWYMDDLDGYGVLHIWYNVSDFMMMSWYLYADIRCHRTFIGCWSRNGCTRVWYGVSAYIRLFLWIQSRIC